MSTIILLKDHNDHHSGEKKKKGDKISVPFNVGKQLIADGIGCYPSQPKPEIVVASTPELESLQSENAALRQRIAALEMPAPAPSSDDPPAGEEGGSGEQGGGKKRGKN
ncbi:MAG TPA: hypothetical protein VFE62_01680 [Gemmataceae bacterium]|nr:hypothetical protein [Gemmataceae bacterium]